MGFQILTTHIIGVDECSLHVPLKIILLAAHFMAYTEANNLK